ncbi:MAG: LacI family DNA-binding transcriptional regulator [Bacteroidales bacterium]|nr:LacI family DNA-binding transcriptional regulator [Bacteroidales bacterium]
MAKIRIKDIAEIARVSVGTVDRVIHNRGEVSPSTREKVRKLLQQFDYKPDIAARSLAMKRDIHLAVVMPGVVSDHTFWELPRQGIRQALEALDQNHIHLHPFYFDQVDRESFTAILDRFPYEKAEGVLFAPVFTEESMAFLGRCAAANLPVILFNSLLDSAFVSSFVGQDAYQSGYVAARLVLYGLEPEKDVAIVNLSARKEHYAHIIERERGFRDHFAHLKGKRKHLLSIDLNGADDLMLKEELGRLCAAHDISGLFVTNSRVHKVARFLEETGRDRVRLVGYDLLPENIEYLKLGRIDFLLSQKPEEQAYKGLLSLFNLVVFNRKPEAKQWLPIDIITRENLRFYQTNTSE